MSDADRDNVTVSTDGITIRKTPDTEQFETLAVVFDITSEREDTVWLRVTDELPDTISIDDVGFHPDYGAEFWDVVDDAVVFEREFDPVEEFTTVFGVREYEYDDLEPFYVDPSVEIIDDDFEEELGSGMDELVSEEDSEVVRQVIAGDRDTLPGMESEPEEVPAAHSSENEVDPVSMPEVDPFGEDDTSEPEEPAQSEAEAESSLDDIEAAAREALAEDAESSDKPVTDEQDTVGASPEQDSDEITVPVTGGVARVLAKELREGNVDPSDRRAIKDELAGEESTDARISHLQSEVSDLRAYTDALEVFLDEQGSGQQLLEEIDSRTGTLESTVSDLETSIETTNESVSSLENSIDSVDADVTSLQDSITQLESLHDRVTQLETAVDSLESQLDEMAAFRDRLASAFGESIEE